ncbi:hypothetical protein Y032_0097g3015 [Ancylostoma ceylanicum]|uniref:Uncharacterized protein n=1 Tax=Ancylostoma ceylanicum TaxID=53326 RepID=A0A016TJZ0_9BILA|nr:hypothetical protein Y032_0097g3015 [Ancylostoma ceylanicum]
MVPRKLTAIHIPDVSSITATAVIAFPNKADFISLKFLPDNWHILDRGSLNLTHLNLELSVPSSPLLGSPLLLEHLEESLDE